MKYIVDRKTWFRGQGISGSRLLREDGLRCCIGFVGQQCGIEDSDLLDRGAVHCSADSGPDGTDQRWPSWFRGGYSSDLRNAYMENDTTIGTEAEREQKLKEIFSRNGDEIEFIN